VPPDHSVDVTNGETFDDDPAYLRSTTGHDGHLHFPTTTQPSLIVVIHASGTAQLNPGTERASTIRLQPWGRIEGRMWIGAKPGAGQDMIAWASPGERGAYDLHAPSSEYVTNIKTDAQGHFVIARIPAGEVAVAENAAFSWGGIERPMRRVHVEPAKTAQVSFGGQGQPVLGSVLIPPDLVARKDWSFRFCMIVPKIKSAAPPPPDQIMRGSLADQARWWDAFDKSDAGIEVGRADQRRIDSIHEATYGFDVHPDGTFRIEDVLPGKYLVDFDVSQNVPKGKPHIMLGHGYAEFTISKIASGRSDEPFEIPALSIDRSRIVTVGNAAPDFVVKGLDDKPIRLADFRGKYVLLEFWATWCGPCLAEMDYMKEVYRRFGGDPRFAMVGLSVDPKPNDPMNYAASHGLAWRQGFLGNCDEAPIVDDAPVVNDYGVEGYPSIWLIGPDGKVIAKNLYEDSILKAVQKA
jgi:peroxiredoxin